MYDRCCWKMRRERRERREVEERRRRNKRKGGKGRIEAERGRVRKCR